MPTKSPKQVRTYMFCVKKKVSIQLQLLEPRVNADPVRPDLQIFQMQPDTQILKKSEP